MNKILPFVFLLSMIAVLIGCGGGAASDFSVEPLDSPGKHVSLSDYKGKVVLLDFWATWCGPCRETMPILDGIYKDYKDKGLQIVSITDESRSDVEAFAKENSHSYPVFLDPDGAANKAYGVSAIPDAVLISKEGTVLWRGHPGDEQELRKMIDRALEF